MRTAQDTEVQIDRETRCDSARGGGSDNVRNYFLWEQGRPISFVFVCLFFTKKRKSLMPVHCKRTFDVRIPGSLRARVTPLNFRSWILRRELIKDEFTTFYTEEDSPPSYTTFFFFSPNRERDFSIFQYRALDTISFRTNVNAHMNQLHIAAPKESLTSDNARG